jgi:hypothetical protein
MNANPSRSHSLNNAPNDDKKSSREAAMMLLLSEWFYEKD